MVAAERLTLVPIRDTESKAEERMSGGIHAKRGFNYQDIVVLDLLITHFDENGLSGRVRPEGIDDLELTWTTSDGTFQKQFVQIKKPREDAATNPTNKPWTLAEITRELIPGTVLRMKGNTWKQFWILGDRLSTDARSLLAAGNDAATQVPQLYWPTVHRLARPSIPDSSTIDLRQLNRLRSWLPRSELITTPEAAITHLLGDFGNILREYLPGKAADEYQCSLYRIHALLPGVISRIRVCSEFGSETIVAERVARLLHSRYSLDSEVVKSTVLRNMRGFVSDVSTIPGRQFDKMEFETELRSIWPTMVPIRNPPPLNRRHLRRPDISDIFTSSWSGRAIEAIGISGAGKTMLAAEVYERSRMEYPARPVFYVEVRRTTELRDVLVGVAFHLRRYGNPGAFHVASTHVKGKTAHDVAIMELACAIARSTIACLVIIDLIEGGCSESFARDLRTMLNTHGDAVCRLALLGQESPFRDLSDMEREQFDVKSIEMRGFSFDEFLALVRQKHGEIDYGTLKEVFDTVTAGRRAGLYARLARSLADASSVGEMRRVSRSPAGQLLHRAERMKFVGLSASARRAAGKLICFALPFEVGEAETVFQDEDVGLAIRELLEVGLVTKTGDDTFEMHETVRAGLEGVVAIGTRREAHGALARHYASMNMVSTEIFHLERAGDGHRARSLARTAFLRGEHWSQLHRYVSSRELVTARDAIDVAVSLGTVDGLYVLRDVVSVLGGPADAEVVLDVIRTQMSRFGSDFSWAMAMVGAYLSLAPEGEIELYRVAVHASCNDRERKNAIGAILITSRGGETVDAQPLIALFDTLPPADQLLFAPVLLHQGNRLCLRLAFEVLSRRSTKRAGQEPDSGVWSSLRLKNVDDVVEFLAALPKVDDAEMLLRRSALVGNIGDYIWTHREFLEGHCVTLLEAYDAEPEIQRGAIRVLAFTGHSSLCTLCEDVGTRTENPVHGFATLAPLLNPGLIDVERYERRLIDPSTPPPVKVACLKILAAGGADLNTWYERLKGIGGGIGSTGEDWDPLWLMLACEYPFRGAITILNDQLSSVDETLWHPAAAAVKSLGMLPFPEATEMLKRAIAHRSPQVRAAGALGLQEKRCGERGAGSFEAAIFGTRREYPFIDRSSHCGVPSKRGRGPRCALREERRADAMAVHCGCTHGRRVGGDGFGQNRNQWSA